MCRRLSARDRVASEASTERAQEKSSREWNRQLVFQRPDVTIAFYSDDVGAGIARRVAPDERRPAWPRPGTNRPQEVTRCMFESDARRPTADNRRPRAASGFEDEEPPGKPRRHPLWEDVPDAPVGRLALADRRTPSAPSASSATCSPSRPRSWKPSARWKPSTSSPSRRTTSR